MISYVTIREFDKDFKKLSRRYKTLSKDFELMKTAAIEVLHESRIDNNSIVKIEGFCSERYTSNKVRKFACMSLKGRGAASGIRVIYVWEEEKKTSFIYRNLL